MTERLLRLLVGLILVCGLPIVLLIILIVWVLTDNFYLLPILSWIVTGEWDNL